MDDLKEAADTLRRSYQEPVDSLKKQLDPEALADQEIEIPPARPASAGTPAVQNPSPAAPSPATAEEIPARPSPEVRDSEPTPSPVTAAASDSQKH